MWGWFFAACVIESLLLVIPGTLLLRAAGLARVDAFCLSPMVSLVLYGAAGVLFSAVGIPCTTLTVAAPLILVSLAVWLALRHRRPWQEPTSLKEVAGELRLPALYVAVGVVAATAVLVGSLGRPDSFIQTWDNVCHFNLVRAFADSHEWSTLATTYYPGASSAFDPFPGTQGYYPAGWHLLGALVVDALGVPVTLAANVVNAVVVGVVWPLGACALMRQLFEGRLARACGAVCCCVFPAFPWNLIERWTLYPNLLAFALLPMALAALLMLTAEGQTRRGRHIGSEWGKSVPRSAQRGLLGRALCRSVRGMAHLVVALFSPGSGPCAHLRWGSALSLGCCVGGPLPCALPPGRGGVLLEAHDQFPAGV